MKATEAMRLALREFADPACRRCRGAGAKGDDLVEGLCRCVRARAPATDPPAAGDAAGDAAGGLPHPWAAITRRAQSIHAAVLLQGVPDDWS